MLAVMLIQLDHLFLSCQGTMSWFLKAWTTNLESVSSQKLFQFFDLANSIDLMAPISSAKRELPKERPSAKAPKNWPNLFLNIAPQDALPEAKAPSQLPFIQPSIGGHQKTSFTNNILGGWIETLRDIFLLYDSFFYI